MAESKETTTTGRPYSNDNDDDDERRYREVLRTLPAKPLHTQRQVGRRCKGLTLKGTRCLVTSCTRNPAAAPLRKGERFCAHHACQACDFPDDEVAPARPVRTELTADQTLELLSTLAGVERPSGRERRRPPTACSSPDIAELHSRRLNIEQRIVDATRQVRELQGTGRTSRTHIASTGSSGSTTASPSARRRLKRARFPSRPQTSPNSGRPAGRAARPRGHPRATRGLRQWRETRRLLLLFVGRELHLVPHLLLPARLPLALRLPYALAAAPADRGSFADDPA